MKYRLGLDLGSGSIGSAIIELDDNNNPIDIIDAGVRIFEVSEGAEDRRRLRSARKNLRRTKKRLDLLAKKLYENKLWVNNTPEGTDKLKSKSPYKIRHDALDIRLKNANYIGRALLHMAKHRGAGFVSAAEGWEEETQEEGTPAKAKSSPYDKMLEYMKKDQTRTLGEYFYKRLLAAEKQQRAVRQKKFALEKKIVDYAIPRYLVKNEFHKFWDKQAEFFPQMNKAGLKQEVYDILFFERPATPYAIGKCSYIREEDRLSKAHPLSEMRRIYEEVNNIRITNDMIKRPLTIEERDTIVHNLLLKGKNAGKQAIKSALGLDNQQKVSLYDDRIIKAYLYSRPEFAEIDYIQSLTEQDFENFIEFLANPVNPEDKSGRLYNEDDLIKRLKTMLKIDSEEKIGKLLTKLPKGRTMLGKTATLAILAKLKAKVITHREATDELSKTDQRFMAEEELARQLQGIYNKLPYYGAILQADVAPLPPLMIQNNQDTLNKDEKTYGKIANPAVHMILNQLRLVINDIIRLYGKPYEINIELGRDVGMSSQKKKQKETEQKANKKLNEKAKKHLLDCKMPVNGKNILKYKLAEEQGWKDAYNPQSNISQKFEGMEIEHIIPQAKGGSDTYNNLCLVNRTDNLNKGDDFAYDYLQKTKSPEQLREILKNVRENTKLQKKAWRFEATAREKFEDAGDSEETSRYLTDTRYVSKMAQRYLRAIIDTTDSEAAQNRILAIKGAQTAKLRKKWNLEGLEYTLMGLDIPRYIDSSPYWVEQDTGVVVDGDKKPDIDGNWRMFDQIKNKNWLTKPRIDHRHHAMDAIILACSNRSLIQKMAHDTGLAKTEYPLPLQSVDSTADFRRRVINVLKEIKVSHKPNHSKLGEFHQAKGLKVLCKSPKDKDALITVYSRRVLDVVKSEKDLSKLLIPDSMKDEWFEELAIDKAKQQKLVEDFKLYLNTAEQILIAETEQLFADGNKKFEITEGRKILKAFRIIQEKGLWKGDKFKTYKNSKSLITIPKHGITYVAGNNHCVDFYEKHGKVCWEVIKRFDINQPDFLPQWKKNGGKIIWSIQQGDLLELNTPEKWASYTDKEKCLARVKKFSDNQFSIDYIADARSTSPEDQSLKYMHVDTLRQGLSFYTTHQARKIELSPFGKIHRKHKALWHGKKAKT